LRVFLAVNDIAMPSEARLAEMARQLFGAREDAAARIEHAGVALARHRGVIRIDANAAGSDGEWRIDWHGEPVLDLGAGRGSVRFEPSHGKGIAAALACVGPWHLMPRAGGEKIRLGSAQRTRTLKNLLQEHDIPAWERQRLPLLFRGQDLVWVPGVGIAAGYACAEGADGLLPCWTVAGRAALC
jgi:tRNA(Ile)-lysidine synthase